MSEIIEIVNSLDGLKLEEWKKYFSFSNFDTLSEQGKKVLLLALRDLIETDDPTCIRNLWEVDYNSVPVTPKQFFEDPYYLGGLLNWRDCWKPELEKVLAFNNRIDTWVLTGAIGTGKTTIAAGAQAYKAYLLNEMKDPHTFYDVGANKEVVFRVFNITLEKVTDTAFPSLQYFIETSPYFKEKMPAPITKKPIISFRDKKIVIKIGSLSDHALGDDMFGFILDEANFFKKVRHEEDVSRAHDIYEAAHTRVVSRFKSSKGVIPGLVCIISSAELNDSFVEKFIKESKDKPAVHISRFALWDAKPPEKGTPTFSVFVGSSEIPSRVLESGELVMDEGEVLEEVPETYRDEFEADTDSALMNLAGISTSGAGLFFPQKDLIYSCISDREHPFMVEDTCKLSVTSDLKLMEYIDKRRMFNIAYSKWGMIKNPGVGRFIHVDLAKNKERVGIAMAHQTFVGGKEVAYLDFMFRIRPPERGEIYFRGIVDFIIALRESGVPIKLVTYDSWQSVGSIQDLVKAGINAGCLSVGYEEFVVLKEAMMQARVDYYRYEPFLEEAKILKRGMPTGERPHHPFMGFDDVCDAVAGVVAHCVGSHASLRCQNKTSTRAQIVAPSAAPPAEVSFGESEYNTDSLFLNTKNLL